MIFSVISLLFSSFIWCLPLVNETPSSEDICFSKMLISIPTGRFVDFVIMLSSFWRVGFLLCVETAFQIPMSNSVTHLAREPHRWLRRKTCHIMAHSPILWLYISLRNKNTRSALSVGHCPICPMLSTVIPCWIYCNLTTEKIIVICSSLVIKAAFFFFIAVKWD